jgi:hypothetical protein
MLKTVKSLLVMKCPKLTHFHELDRIKELAVGGNAKSMFTMSSGIELFDRLSDFRATRLILESDNQDSKVTHDTISWEKLTMIRSLSLFDCFFRAVPCLIHLSSLIISGCEDISVITLDLPALNDLLISGCDALTTVHLTDPHYRAKHPVHFLKINYCPGLKSVFISRAVFDLKVMDCEMLFRNLLGS